MASSNKHAPTALPEDYIPSSTTVIVGRGKKIKAHAGNRAMVMIVQSELTEYLKAEKTAKSFIIRRVLKKVLDRSNDKIGFVKQDSNGRWLHLSTKHARACIAQEFRDALSGQYRSSKHSKQRRRLQAKGYDLVPANMNPSTAKYEPPSMTQEQVTLLSGIAQGFRQQRAQHQSTSQTETLQKIRSLIHVPSRHGCDSSLPPNSDRQVSYQPSGFLQQIGRMGNVFPSNYSDSNCIHGSNSKRQLLNNLSNNMSNVYPLVNPDPLEVPSSSSSSNQLNFDVPHVAINAGFNVGQQQQHALDASPIDLLHDDPFEEYDDTPLDFMTAEFVL